jgi:hypothetical protein
MAERIVTCDVQMDRDGLPSYFVTSQVLRVSALCDTTGVKPITHFRPYPLKHVTIELGDGSDDSSSQLRNILWYRG